MANGSPYDIVHTPEDEIKKREWDEKWKFVKGE
jgi:hypothetical protein